MRCFGVVRSRRPAGRGAQRAAARRWPGWVIAVMITGSGGLTSSLAAETLTVTLDKAEILRLDRAPSTVMVGNPDVVDVSLESARVMFLIGKAVGETNLLVLDREGNSISAYDVVVVPEVDRHLTVNRGSDGVTTLSCLPRCVGVKNPGVEAAGKAAAPAAASAAAPAAPAAASAAPPAAPAPAPGEATPSDAPSTNVRPFGQTSRSM